MINEILPLLLLLLSLLLLLVVVVVEVEVVAVVVVVVFKYPELAILAYSEAEKKTLRHLAGLCGRGMDPLQGPLPTEDNRSTMTRSLSRASTGILIRRPSARAS
jgi:hypothetical protein